VNAKSNLIKKAIRTPVSYKKSQAQNALVTTTEELIQLSKEAHGLSKGGIKKTRVVKEPEKQWFELIDALTSQLEEFARTAGKAGITQAEAKSAWNKVNQKCTNCHTVFRVEEQD
jgi:cytochrome c556